MTAAASAKVRSAKAKKSKLAVRGNAMTRPTSLLMMRDSKGRRRKMAKTPVVTQRAFGKQSTGKTEAETPQAKINREQASKAVAAQRGKTGRSPGLQERTPE